MTSDFFLEEAGPWRQEAWDIMRQRSGVIFYLPTKRPRRVESCLPPDWGDGRESISFNVPCENQRRTDERIPILLSLPVRHKGICAAPMIGPVEIDNYLAAGQIEEVRCGGENYDGCRPCRYEWVKALSGQCRKRNITFCFVKRERFSIKETGGTVALTKRYSLSRSSVQVSATKENKRN